MDYEGLHKNDENAGKEQCGVPWGNVTKKIDTTSDGGGVGLPL